MPGMDGLARSRSVWDYSLLQGRAMSLTVHTHTAGETGLLVNSYLLESPDGVLAVDTSLRSRRL
ncbi:hypothetical protein BH23ACT8_BH23ACT8_09840 [soil metagenome]